MLAAFIPPVTITRLGPSIIIQWTNGYAPAMLAEQSADPGPAWSPLTNAPALTATNTWAIALPLEAAARSDRGPSNAHSPTPHARAEAARRGVSSGGTSQALYRHLA